MNDVDKDCIEPILNGLQRLVDETENFDQEVEICMYSKIVQ